MNKTPNAWKAKLGPAERNEVNSLIESAQYDFESVWFPLVWQREEAQAQRDEAKQTLALYMLNNGILEAQRDTLLSALKGMVNIATHPKATLAQIRTIANEARAEIAAVEGELR